MTAVAGEHGAFAAELEQLLAAGRVQHQVHGGRDGRDGETFSVRCQVQATDADRKGQAAQLLGGLAIPEHELGGRFAPGGDDLLAVGGEGHGAGVAQPQGAEARHRPFGQRVAKVVRARRRLHLASRRRGGDGRHLRRRPGRLEARVNAGRHQGEDRHEDGRDFDLGQRHGVEYSFRRGDGGARRHVSRGKRDGSFQCRGRQQHGHRRGTRGIRQRQRGQRRGQADPAPQQALPEPLPRLRQPARQRPLVPAQLARGVRPALAFQAAEYERGAELARQARDLLVQHLLQVAQRQLRRYFGGLP